MDSGTVLINLASGLVGSIIGAGISILTTKWTIIEKNNSDQKEENKSIIHSLMCIRSELNSVYMRYYNQIGNQFENTPSQQAIAIYLPVQEEYFPVYKNNTSIIGKIENKDTIENIINCYTCAVGMIDSIRFNNSLYDNYEKTSRDILNAHSQDELISLHNNRNSAQKAICDYWEQLRKHHSDLRRLASLAYAGMTAEITIREKILEK